MTNESPNEKGPPTNPPTSPPAYAPSTPAPPPSYSLLELTQADHDDYQRHLLRYHLRTLGISPDFADTIPIPVSSRSSIGQSPASARALHGDSGIGRMVVGSYSGEQARPLGTEHGAGQRGDARRRGWVRSVFEWIAPPGKDEVRGTPAGFW